MCRGLANVGHARTHDRLTVSTLSSRANPGHLTVSTLSSRANLVPTRHGCGIVIVIVIVQVRAHGGGDGARGSQREHERCHACAGAGCQGSPGSARRRPPLGAAGCGQLPSAAGVRVYRGGADHEQNCAQPWRNGLGLRRHSGRAWRWASA